VHFDLSADQTDLRDAAAALLGDLAAPERVRKVVDGEERWDRELWRALVDQGWLALEVPEDRGGLSLGAVEVAVIAEQVGRHLAPVPVLDTILALGAVGAAEKSGDLGQWLDRLVGGEAVGCVSVAEGSLVASRDAAAWRVDGRAGAPVVAAPIADIAVVAAAGDEPGLYAVDISDLRPPAEPAMDRTRALGWLELDGAPAARLGGREATERLVDRGATFASAELLGTAERMMEESVAYATEREQFGRPIGSFQAVKHRCADMLVDVEGMRSATWWAAWCVSVDDPERSVAASTAKIWCSDAGRRVTESALQVHGGIGFTWEHDVHLYLKRAHLTSLQFGDAAHHRRRLAAQLQRRVEAGDRVV
jgi:alkylation response protein AidB-like acyl-CoA dehydrogenase